jgi:hypothetical protein
MNISEIIEEFKNLKIADGRVIEVQYLRYQLHIICLNWQERELRLTFDGVVGVEFFDLLDEDLSHISVDQKDTFIQRVHQTSQDETEELLCFSFWSAWSDEPLMRVVANEVAVTYL